MYTLITGASSGIGKALAIECASRNMDVLLVALEDELLHETARQLRSEYKISCPAFGVDLSCQHSADKVYAWVKENGYKINMLVNNVGIGSKGLFDEMPVEFYRTQINLNIMSTCIMSRLFIPELKANAPSYLLNVGSMGGFFTMPEKIVYAASKAFVHSFTEGLQMELENAGITISVVCPGGTDSNHKTIAINKDLKGVAKASILQPAQVAKEAIDNLLKGKERIIPGALNRIIFSISRMVPKFIKNFFVRRAFSHVKKHEY